MTQPASQTYDIDPALGDSWLVAQNPLQKNAICAVKRRSSRSCRPLPVGAAARREHRRRWRKERERERVHSSASLAHESNTALVVTRGRSALSEACQRLENVKAMLWRPDETTVGDEIVTETDKALLFEGDDPALSAILQEAVYGLQVDAGDIL